MSLSWSSNVVDFIKYRCIRISVKLIIKHIWWGMSGALVPIGRCTEIQNAILDISDIVHLTYMPWRPIISYIKSHHYVYLTEPDLKDSKNLKRRYLYYLKYFDPMGIRHVTSVFRLWMWSVQHTLLCTNCTIIRHRMKPPSCQTQYMSSGSGPRMRLMEAVKQMEVQLL
jgi:hypothetical protein